MVAAFSFATPVISSSTASVRRRSFEPSWASATTVQVFRNCTRLYRECMHLSSVRSASLNCRTLAEHREGTRTEEEHRGRHTARFTAKWTSDRSRVRECHPLQCDVALLVDSSRCILGVDSTVAWQGWQHSDQPRILMSWGLCQPFINLVRPNRKEPLRHSPRHHDSLIRPHHPRLPLVGCCPERHAIL